MATKSGDRNTATLEQLRSKLNVITLQSAIQDIANLDLTEIQCCHTTQDSKQSCGCTETCRETLAAILCKFKIHDATRSIKVPINSHTEHEQTVACGSSSDLSFTSERSHDSSNNSSQSNLSHLSQGSDDCHHHDHDDLGCTDHAHDHDDMGDVNSDQSLDSSSGTEKTPVDCSLDSSTSGIEKKNEHGEVHDERIPDYLKEIVSQLPHSLAMGHHHHFHILSIQEPCDFHSEYVIQKLDTGEVKCACAWIKGTLALAFGTIPVAHSCCKIKDEGHIATRNCCLNDHDLDAESEDSLEPLWSESGSLIPPKTLRYLSLGVTGMTCTTCETKLAKTLRKINGIVPKGAKGVKTSFMRGKAEIWCNSSVITDPQEEICAVVKRMTGFTCKILSDTDRLNCNYSTQTVRVKLKFSNNFNFNWAATQKHIHLLKGVTGTQEIQNFGQPITTWGLLKEIWRRNRVREQDPDPEKGTIGESRKTIDIKYDPQRLRIRNLLRYLKTSPGNPSVKLAETEDPEIIAAEQSRFELRKLLFLTILSSILTFPILLITWIPSIKTQVPAATDMNPVRLKNYVILHTICFVLATLVQVLGKRIYINAFRSIFFQRRLDMDCLITLSTTAAYIYSLVFWSINIARELEKLVLGELPTDPEAERHDPIFEASALLITLILAGRLLTGYIRHWATNRISVGTLQPSICTRASENTFRPIRNRHWRTEDVRLLHYGDILLARTGDVIVTDGVVVNGDATVDESHMTGESEPAQYERNSTVIAGSKVIEGRLEYKITRLVPENTVSSMKRLVSAASSSRPKLQDYADKVAVWLTPIVLIIALAAFGGWLGYYRTVKKSTEDLSAAFTKALTIAITILAISCPCAIALAVPTVLIFATQVGVKCGVVIKSPESIEKAKKVRYFVADKTGTLTTGKLRVVAAKYWVHGEWVDDTGDKDVYEIQSLICKLVARDSHPVSKAVFDSLKQHQPKNIILPDAGKNIRSIVGKGIEGTFHGRRIRGGKPSWVLMDSIKNFSKLVFKETVEDAARTPFVVVDTRNATVLAIFGLSDTIRPEAASVISKLQAQNIECFMLSGDQLAVCQQVAEALGIPQENVYGECSPEDKAQRIRLLQTRARMYADLLRLRGCLIRRIMDRFCTERRYVMFLGDGTNDAAALKQADIGITMSNCTEIAAGCADAGILSSSLTGVLALIALSKRAMNLIKCNFAWALKYNLGAILISTGIIPWTLSPQYAGVGEAVSVAPVFIIASTILWWRLRY